MARDSDRQGQRGGTRRDFLRQASAAGGAAIMTMATPGAGAWVAGSDAPELTELRVGFIPLTDCAPVVMAAHLGLDRKHGIRIIPTREASWAAVRDKLVSGELHAAQALYGLVYGVQMGLGGPRTDMAVLMTLNRNGQGITLARHLRDQGVVDGPSLAALVARRQDVHPFAQTFPTGTHAMWLYYWLAAQGIDPMRDVNPVVVPPPQVVAALGAGRIDGCCVGEPWNARAIREGVGFTVATSQQVWKDHPEKVLGATADFVDRHPNSARALVMALLETARIIDAPERRAEVARVIAGPDYLDTPVEDIEGRLRGHYEDGLGRAWTDPDAMKFHADGAVNFPWLSDGMWFLTQHRRWGLLREEPDYLGVARRVNRTALYREAAAALQVPTPAGDTRKSVLMDGAVWDGSSPAEYAAAFPIRVA